MHLLCYIHLHSYDPWTPLDRVGGMVVRHSGSGSAILLAADGLVFDVTSARLRVTRDRNSRDTPPTTTSNNWHACTVIAGAISILYKINYTNSSTINSLWITITRRGFVNMDLPLNDKQETDLQYWDHSNLARMLGVWPYCSVQSWQCFQGSYLAAKSLRSQHKRHTDKYQKIIGALCSELCSTRYGS